jgi:hypothetical protein
MKNVLVAGYLQNLINLTIVANINLKASAARFLARFPLRHMEAAPGTAQSTGENKQRKYFIQKWS